MQLKVPRLLEDWNGEGRVLTYFAVILLSSNACSLWNGLGLTATTYFLKDGLKLSPEGQAWFWTLTGIPNYLFVFSGLLRDRWSPFGIGDRGYLLLSAPVAEIAYLYIATGKVGFASMVAATLVLSVAFQTIGAAIQGSMTAAGQRLGMTGRLASLSTAYLLLFATIATLIGGWLATRFAFVSVMGLLALLTAPLFALGFWRPDSSIELPPAERPSSQSMSRDVIRLFRWRPLWPVVGISALWAISPNVGTSLFLRLSVDAQVSEFQYSVFIALSSLYSMGTALLYGYLCRRFKLRSLMFLAAFVVAVQGIPFIFVHNFGQTMVAALFSGLIAGFFGGALLDLQMRVCPVGLEATAMAIIVTTVTIVSAASNQWGASLYSHGNYPLSVWISGGFTLVALPLILLIPRSIGGRSEASLQFPAGPSA